MACIPRVRDPHWTHEAGEAAALPGHQRVSHGQRYVIVTSVRAAIYMLSLELYMLAFISLRSQFTSRELNELGDTMAERGIRMRRSLDEALDGWAEPDSVLASGTREDGLEWGEEEIEHNAEELRRLKPY